MEKLIAVDKEITVRCPQSGNEWIEVTIWAREKIVPEAMANQSEIKTFTTFAGLYQACENGEILNCEATSTFFGHPLVRCNNASAMGTICITEKNFKYFDVRVTYVPHPEWSIDYLRKNLCAEDFALLCENRNWKIF